MCLQPRKPVIPGAWSLGSRVHGQVAGGGGRPRKKGAFPSRLAVKVEDLESWAGGGEMQGPVAAPGLAQRADEPPCPAASSV